MKGSRKLAAILSRWRLKHYSIAIGMLMLTAVIAYLLNSVLDLRLSHVIPVAAISSGIILLIHYLLRPKQAELIALINQKIDQTEYSTHLLEKEDKTLNLLQRIQKSKVEESLLQSNLKTPIKPKAIYSGVMLAGLSLLLLFGFSSGDQIESVMDQVDAPTVITQLQSNQIKSDSISLKSVSIKIEPLAYTNIEPSYTKNLSLTAPEGSSINWHFDIVGNPDQKQIIFEDQYSRSLNGNNSYLQRFDQASFYNYKISKEGQAPIESEYFPIKIIEDQNAKIDIQGVEEYQRLEFKENHEIKFDIKVSDDYGLTNLFVSSTLAKGAGEAVKFREKQTTLEDLTKGAKNYNGQFSFSTKALDMEPGDELYFYVAAKDNCPFENHWSKSTTYFVVLEDTAQVSLVDVGGMQMDLMPDFFRSQRQIIIDTEKLIGEKDTLPEDAFKQRSNELGYDQKLLRLKYGQFLGEEAESGLDFDNDVDLGSEEDGHDHSDPNHSHADDGSDALNDARSLIEQFMHDHDHEEEENQLLESKGTEKIEEAKNPEWVQDMSHSHDNTEEATFFDVSIKGKLRAALNEMWDAELHLRLADPEKSLPYQYNSLSFLDEVKNHARAYVQRIGFEPPAIKEQEKRLTGELKEVYSTRDILKPKVDSQQNYLKSALSIIIGFQNNPSKNISQQESATLNLAAVELSQIGLQQSEYLPLLSILRSIGGNRTALNNKDYALLIKGISQLISDSKQDVVGEKYFRHPINMKVIQEFKKAL